MHLAALLLYRLLSFSFYHDVVSRVILPVDQVDRVCNCQDPNQRDRQAQQSELDRSGKWNRQRCHSDMGNIVNNQGRRC